MGSSREVVECSSFTLPYECKFPDMSCYTDESESDEEEATREIMKEEHELDEFHIWMEMGGSQQWLRKRQRIAT